ncbi:MAG: hypothetical protein ABIH35_03290 [Patescibacteria group bacterium]
MALPQNFVTIISFTLIAGVLAVSAALLPAGTTEESKDLPMIEYQPPVPVTAFRERDDYDLLLLNLKPVKLKVAEEISAEPEVAKKIKRPLLTAISEKFESLFAAAGSQPIGPAITTEGGGTLTMYDAEDQPETAAAETIDFVKGNGVYFFLRENVIYVVTSEEVEGKQLTSLDNFQEHQEQILNVIEPFPEVTFTKISAAGDFFIVHTKNSAAAISSLIYRFVKLDSGHLVTTKLSIISDQHVDFTGNTFKLGGPLNHLLIADEAESYDQYTINGNKIRLLTDVTITQEDNVAGFYPASSSEGDFAAPESPSKHFFLEGAGAYFLLYKNTVYVLSQEEVIENDLTNPENLKGYQIPNRNIINLLPGREVTGISTSGSFFSIRIGDNPTSGGTLIYRFTKFDSQNLIITKIASVDDYHLAFSDGRIKIGDPLGHSVVVDSSGSYEEYRFGNKRARLSVKILEN